MPATICEGGLYVMPKKCFAQGKSLTITANLNKWYMQTGENF